MFKPSDEQVAIGEGVKASIVTRECIPIDAGAGTGKSTALMFLIADIIPEDENIMVLAFNKKIKKELEERIKKSGRKNASAKTFNGLGYSTWLKRYSVKDADKEVWLDDRKYKKIARYLVDRAFPADHPTERLKEAAEMLEKLFNFFRFNTTRNHNAPYDLRLFMGGSIDDPGTLVHHDPKNITALRRVASRYKLFLEEQEDEEVIYPLIAKMFDLGKTEFEYNSTGADHVRRDGYRDTALKSIASSKQRWVDFTDQVYWCVVDQYKVWGSDIIMVDEAQDTSPLDRALIEMHRRRYGKRGFVIIVGDEKQAIYKFRGADGEGFRNSMIFFGMKKAYPLSVSYRVGQVIAERAALWKEGYKAAPSNVRGEIDTVNEEDFLTMAQDGDAAISRVRSLLVTYWRKLIKAGKPAIIIGANMTDSIERHLDKIAELEGFSWSKILPYIQRYEEIQLHKMHEAERTEDVIDAFLDDVSTLTALVEDIEAPSKDAFLDKLKKELDPANQPEGGIQIMTGHGSKGLEFRRVFDISPDKFPMTWKGQEPEDYIQEKNLAYVKDTRAKEALYFVDPKAPSYLKRKEMEAAKAVEPVEIITEEDDDIIPIAAGEYGAWEPIFNEPEYDDDDLEEDEEFDFIPTPLTAEPPPYVPALWGPMDEEIEDPLLGLFEEDDEPEPVRLFVQPKGDSSVQLVIPPPSAISKLKKAMIEFDAPDYRDTAIWAAAADYIDIQRHEPIEYPYTIEARHNVNIGDEWMTATPVTVEPPTFHASRELSTDLKTFSLVKTQERLMLMIKSMSEADLKRAAQLLDKEFKSKDQSPAASQPSLL
jgi:hypothetical protein